MIDGRRHRQGAQAELKGAIQLHLEGFGRRLARAGFPPDALTLAGVLLAAASAAMIGTGRLVVGAALLGLSGAMDAADGLVARAARRSSVRGAFLDSVADRVCDGLLFGGAAWYLLTTHTPRTALLPVGILAVGALISYERAKAESLGLDARGGLMERAERLVVLAAGLLAAGLLAHGLLVPILGAELALCCLTAAGRFIRVWRLADTGPPHCL